MKEFITIFFIIFITIAGLSYADRGFDAGYYWAEDKGIKNTDDCGGNSDSFIEGCKIYVDESYGFNNGYERAAEEGIRDISLCEGYENFIRGCEHFINKYESEVSPRYYEYETEIILILMLIGGIVICKSVFYPNKSWKESVLPSIWALIAFLALIGILVGIYMGGEYLISAYIEKN